MYLSQRDGDNGYCTSLLDLLTSKSSNCLSAPNSTSLMQCSSVDWKKCLEVEGISLTLCLTLLSSLFGGSMFRPKWSHYSPRKSAIILWNVQKISIPPPRKINGNSKGEGVAKVNVFKEMHGAKLEFPEGTWEVQIQKPSTEGEGGGMDIFWNHTL